MSGDILFLAHRLPFPPNRGDKIRSFHILHALGKLAPVHVGCFVESDEDRRQMGELAKFAASYCVAWRRKPLLNSGVEAILRREPVSLSAFRSPDLAHWVHRLLDSGRIGAVYVFSGQMGQFIPRDWDGHFIMDLVDVDSAKFEAYAEHASFPMSWVNAREGKLLAQFEAQLAERADHTLLVSEVEAELMRIRAPQGRDIRPLCNGIDAGTFSPGSAEPAEEMRENGPHFVFTGQMDYPPNVTAVARMAQSILPKVRKKQAGATFHIVGRAPTPEVEALAQFPGCRVHGEVPDMRPYLAGADIVVAPLTIARGVQNKVLEAMAMERPVVLSAEAATGIDAKHGRHFIVAEDDARFAKAICRLVEDPAGATELGKSARTFVVDNQSWAATLAPLPKLMGLDGGIVAG